MISVYDVKLVFVSLRQEKTGEGGTPFLSKFKNL